MWRPPLLLRFVLLCALLLGLPACSGPTEIVVRLVASGAIPAVVTVKLHRMVPFNDNPASTPAYVVPVLNGADLDLMVMPQGSETVLSLLPTKGSGDDLRVTVLAPNWSVSPSGPQAAMFMEGKSQQLRFVISEPLPDGGVKDGGRDMAAPKGDMAGPNVDMRGAGDAGKPVDMVAGKG